MTLDMSTIAEQSHSHHYHVNIGQHCYRSRVLVQHAQPAGVLAIWITWYYHLIEFLLGLFINMRALMHANV
jgi:hypothetical protein